MSQTVILYTIAGCPHCDAAREELEWRGVEFEERDVEQDAQARDQMLLLTGGARTVPVLVEAGKPAQIGWMGRGCSI